MIIDYEYGGWNPMAMDIANYLNETMLDNSYPEKNGIKCYIDNCMSNREIYMMSKRYLENYFIKYMNPHIKEKFFDC